MGYLLADGGLRVLHGAHHLEEVVVAALQRGRGGRRFGDANRGEPPAELVGIGHGGCGMRVGKDGHGGTRNPTLSGGGPAPPCPRRRLGGRRGREDGGRGCKPACKGGEGQQSLESGGCRTGTRVVWMEVGGEEPKIHNTPFFKIIRIIPVLRRIRKY